MRPEIADKLPALRELCANYRIRELYLFGSAASTRPGEFDPERSDYDFLVEFLDDDLGPWMKRYFDFKVELETLLDRPVDLMFLGALHEPHSRVSPYFKAAVEASKVPVYAAA
jgi:predicted nucleotidyltransferase